MKNFLSNNFLIFCFVFLNLQAQEDHNCKLYDIKGRAREKNVQFTNLNLDLKLIEKKGDVDGKCVYTFEYLRKDIDTLFLDGITMNFSQVLINDAKVNFKSDSAGITIYLPKEKQNINTLTISYSCHPKKGLYFLNWNNDSKIARKQIWSQGQGTDNRHWIPGFDDVSNLQTVTSNINFNKNYPLISNGDLIDTVHQKDGTITWTYQMKKPHALYLIMIGAGDYKMKKLVSKNDIVLEQYYYPDLEYTFEPTYKHSTEMMDWMEEETGIEFPWGKVYRNIPTQDFLFGAMENTTSTVFTDFYHQDSRALIEKGYEAVNAHELAHQWFGDLITERNPTHHWLHESFATHYSKQFMKHQYGDKMYDWIRKHEMENAFNASKNNDFPVAHSQGGSARHYPKGSLVLDMLREVMGNEYYRKTITNYLNRYKHQNVESNDLQEQIYINTGLNLDWFFDQWVYKGGEPELLINTIQNENYVTIIANQIHKQNDIIKSFILPMDVHIFTKNGKEYVTKHQLKSNADTLRFTLNENEALDYVLVDPNAKMLRKINYNHPFETDLNILESNTIDFARMEAAQRLKKIDLKIIENKLYALFHKEESPLVKIELLKLIPYNYSNSAMDSLILLGLMDDHFMVRRESILASCKPSELWKSQMIKLLKDSSYTNIEHAFHKLCSLYPNECSQFLDSMDNVEGSNHNIAIIRAYGICKHLNDSIEYRANIEKLKSYASPNYEFRTRSKAVEYLFELNSKDNDFLLGLVNSLDYFNPTVRNFSLRVLKKYYLDDPTGIKTFIKSLDTVKDKEQILRQISN